MSDLSSIIKFKDMEHNMLYIYNSGVFGKQILVRIDDLLYVKYPEFKVARQITGYLTESKWSYNYKSPMSDLFRVLYL